LIPFELDIYLTMLVEFLKELEEERKKK